MAGWSGIEPATSDLKGESINRRQSDAKEVNKFKMKKGVRQGLCYVEKAEKVAFLWKV